MAAPARELDGLGAGPARQSRSAGGDPVPHLHRPPGLPARGGGAHQRLPPRARPWAPEPCQRQRDGGRQRSRRPDVEAAGLAHRRGLLLPSLQAGQAADRRLLGPLPDRRRRHLRQRVLPHGGVPPAEVRGAAPRRRRRAARPRVQGQPHRRLLRGRPRHRPPARLAGHPVPLQLDAAAPVGLPLLVGRAFLAHRPLRVDAAPRAPGRDRRHRRRQPGPQPRHRADRAAPYLRGCGDEHRRRRSDRHRRARRHRAAAFRDRPQGAPLRRAGDPHPARAGGGGTGRQAARRPGDDRAPAAAAVALAPPGQRLLRRRGALPHRRGGREDRRAEADQRRGPAAGPAYHPALRRLPGGGRGPRPPRPHPGGVGRPVRRRRAGGHLGQARGRRLQRRRRQDRLSPGGDRGAGAGEPVPARPRPGGARGARGQRLPVARRRGRRRHLQAADPGHLRAARAGALPARARPGAGHGAAARQRRRPGQAGDGRGHRLAQGAADRQPRRGQARLPREGPSRPEDRGRDRPRRSARQAAAGRGDAVAGGPGGAGARPRAAARSAARFHHAGQLPPDHRRQPQPGLRLPAVRREPRRRGRRRAVGRPARPRHGAPQLQAGALLQSGRRGRPRGRRAGDGRAARRPDHLQDPREGGQRPRALRLRHRRDRRPPAGAGAAGAAPLRAARRPLQGGGHRPHRRG